MYIRARPALSHYPTRFRVQRAGGSADLFCVWLSQGGASCLPTDDHWPTRIKKRSSKTQKDFVLRYTVFSGARDPDNHHYEGEGKAPALTAPAFTAVPQLVSSQHADSHPSKVRLLLTDPPPRISESIVSLFLSPASQSKCIPLRRNFPVQK